MKERIAGYKKHMIATLSLAVLVLAIVYFPWPNRNQRCYKMLVSYSAQLQEMRKLDRDSTKRKLFQKRVERNLKPLLLELAQDSANGDLGATYLHAAAKQSLLPLLGACSMSRRSLEESFVANMDEAAKYIRGVTPPTLESFGRQPASIGAKPVLEKRSAQRSADRRNR
jgi:hypothetical protein